MVESKLTKVKVNNEIELCEVYDNATKERIKKVFFREGISFFIKFKKKFQMTGLASVNLAQPMEDETDTESVSVISKNEEYREKKEGRFIICVNKSQEMAARNAIKRVVSDYHDRITFFDDAPKNKGNQLSFRRLIALN